MNGQESSVDLSGRRRVHVVGAGGAGMSAIALVLSRMGHEVTGSDLKSSRALERLAAAGLDVRVGHDAALVEGAELVAISTAIGSANVELQRARELGVPVLSRADLLAAIAGLRRSVAVAGTHGKTTTTSMLALILVQAGMRPSFIVGGDVNDIGTNAAWDDGEWLVVEADESDGTFLRLHPEIALVTSLEPDHLEHYGSYDELRSSFARFVAGAGRALVYGDAPDSAALLGTAPAGSALYGRSPAARFKVSDVHTSRAEATFSLSDAGEPLGRFSLPVPGEHNALNAAAATGAALMMGASAEDARLALARFAGVARRYEFRGERRGVTFVDDYAHLPGEVAATLAAARRGGYSRVVAVFQPHRYSRTQALASQFADAFVDADVVVVTAVYAAGEAARPGVSGQLVVDAVRAAHPEADVSYVPDHESLLEVLRQTLRPGDLCISLEAGDLAGLPDELLSDERW
ncbi:MAG TPA: UDP-N-acetylmuramate--L-alanine ligase [Acidimicrobiales bacterium]|nr:UDP-N-acetylmuramate--L-alanine ligase [Acidimicrobiales bacterium]